MEKKSWQKKTIIVKNIIDKVPTNIICKKFGISKQYVSYWRDHKMKDEKQKEKGVELFVK